MDLGSTYTGTRLKDYTCSLTWRDTMNYAASIHDTNPVYFDDERPKGIIAHPMQAVAITWPVVEKIWEYVDAPDFPREALLTQVHYTEHLEFHRPLRPDDKLRIKGRIAAIGPHRAGTHTVIRFDAIDSLGKTVFTEHIGAMLRGVQCRGDARGIQDLPHVPGYNAGGNYIRETRIPIDLLTPFIYDGCTNIVFPIHTSVKFAREVGLPGRILQGTATLAMAITELIDQEAGRDPSLLRELSCRFSGMIIPGEDIVIRLLHKEAGNGTNLFFEVENARGQKAISHGYARLQDKTDTR
ncbi:MAG: MaoC/PaaZ C-terminal domain-containing protein [Thermodesulfobacteriota bacterium]|nr:MaoC/PaaZ C-terminal domain-containing protein [Thermodesulfobacteriota bacterium]